MESQTQTRRFDQLPLKNEGAKVHEMLFALHSPDIGNQLYYKTDTKERNSFADKGLRRNNKLLLLKKATKKTKNFSS